LVYDKNMSRSQKRIRKQVPFYATTEEKAEIVRRAHSLGIPTGQYIRDAALGPVFHAPSMNLEDRTELRRQGVNLNQLTKALNSAQIPCRDEMMGVVDELRAVWKRTDLYLTGDWEQVKQLLKKLKKGRAK
jgi:hypothetical protein